MHGAPRPMSPPLDPSADEARQWAVDELSKAIYTQGPSLVERILTWLTQLWERLMLGGASGAVLLPILILALVAAIVTAALLLGGPVRRRRLRAGGDSAVVLDDDDRGTQALSRSADAAAEAGDYAVAVLERFRAIVRSLDERAILTDRRGRTAHEASTEAGTRLPDQAADLARAGALFDAVCYGSARPGPAQDSWLREVARQIERARPVAVTGAAPAGWSVVR